MLREDAENGTRQDSERFEAVKNESSLPGYEVPCEEIIIKEEKTEAADSDDDRTAANSDRALAMPQSKF